MHLLGEASSPIMEEIALSREAQLHRQDHNDGGGGGTPPCSVGEAPPPLLLGTGLHVMPTSFLDPAHCFLEHMYLGLDKGYGVSAAAVGKQDADGDAYLYGEVTPAGVRQMLAFPEIQRALGRTLDDAVARCNSLEDPVVVAGPSRSYFLDLGSGTGKLVVEACCVLNGHLVDALRGPEKDVEGGVETPDFRRHLSSNTNLVVCVGVELAEERHRIAMEALRRSSDALLHATKASPSPSPAAPLPTCMPACVAAADVGGLELAQVYCADFFDPIPHEALVAVCFACALGFDAALTKKLCDRILSMVSGKGGGGGGGGSGGSLTCAVLLIRRPDEVAAHDLFAKAAKTRRDVVIATTWMDEAPAIVLTF